MTYLRKSWNRDANGATADQPMRLEWLADGERIVIRAFRQWVSGRDQAEAAWNEIAGAYGGRSGRAVMAALILLVERLRDSARRRIRHHSRCCPCLAADEIRLLDLIGAAGAGRIRHAQAYAADLLGREVEAGNAFAETLAVAEAARTLAQAMAPAMEGMAPRNGARIATVDDATRPVGRLH
jgi:hypothetical protein